MAQEISLGIKDLIAQAKAEIQEIDVEEAARMVREDNAVIVDIRDIRELWRDGRIPGAYHVPRGMLEFWIAPDSPYHKEQFTHDRPYIFSCAGGMRSALATQAAQRMGLKPVFNMIGGFGAWKSAGEPVEAMEKP